MSNNITNKAMKIVDLQRTLILICILMGWIYAVKAATVDDIVVCKNNYVLCFDDWNGNGTAKPGKGQLFGNGHFLDVTGGSVATNKGKVNLSVLNEADDNHVTQYIVDTYGADYPDDHYNSWRLKNAQDVIAMKVTAKSKLIFFLQGNSMSGKEARIPKIATDAALNNALNDAPGEDFPTTDIGFRYEWTAPDDGLIYIGSYNGDTFFSFLIVEAMEAPGTPTIKVGDQTYEGGLWFREVTCKANDFTIENSEDKIPTLVTYTTDGSTPTAASPKYTEPIKCYQNMTVKFQAYQDWGVGAMDDFICDGADVDANVNFKFNAPTIVVDGANFTIVSEYEGQGATNYYAIDGSEYPIAGNSATLTESAVVTAYTEIANGSHGTFTSMSTTKDVYVLNALKGKKTLAVTAGDVVLDEIATEYSTTGPVYMIENGEIDHNIMEFFIKDPIYSPVVVPEYQAPEGNERYIRMDLTNITFKVAASDVVKVKVTCSKNSCKNLNPNDDPDVTTDRKCYVNVNGTNYGNDDVTAENGNIIEFELKGGKEITDGEGLSVFEAADTYYTFQKYSGTGNIKIGKIEFDVVSSESQIVPTPTFSKNEYTLTINCSNPSATIYYTTNGSTPTKSSTKYTGPIILTQNCTVKAIAVADGYEDSEVAEYVVDWFVSPPGTATPANPSVVSFTITGNFPKVNFNIPAEDVDGKLLQTDLLYYTVWIQKGNAVEQLTLTTDLYVKLTEDITEIPYTFTDDYDILVGGSSVYLNQDISELQSWSKIGVQSIYYGGNERNVSNIGWYDVVSMTCSKPVFAHTEGTNVVTITTSTENATIYYTTDGSTPTKSSTLYTGPITMTQNCTVKAIAVADGYWDSEVAEYVVDWFEKENWTWRNINADFTNQSFFTEADADITTAGLKMNEDGTFTRVEAEDKTANAVITGKYHSNEHGISNFSTTVPVEGSVKITFGTCAWGGDVTVKNAEGTVVATMNINTGACYFSDKKNNIVSCYYMQDVATTLLISGGSYVSYFAVEKLTDTQLYSPFISRDGNTLTMSCSNPSATIYYTTDGSTPTRSSTLYTEPITMTQNCTVKAIAVADGYNDSEVAEYAVDWFEQTTKKSWIFTDGLSDETIANLNADVTNWASNGTDLDGNTINWKNATKPSPDTDLMANGEVIAELKDLRFNIGANKDNSIHIATTKLRLTRKSTKITFPQLLNGQKITIQGRSANATATNRGIAPVQSYIQFQAEESSPQTDGECIFVGSEVEGSEDTYTFVWKVVTDSSGPVDVQFQLTPDGGIDFTYFMIDDGDTPVVKDAYAVLSENNTVLTFYYDNKKDARGGMSVGPFNGSPNFQAWNSEAGNITTVIFDKSFANCTTLTSTACWFTSCNKLTTIKGISNLKTDNVTDMSWMFTDCASLTSIDLSGFNTENVTNMKKMFAGSGLTSIDVSNLNTGNVTDMEQMFSNCYGLTNLDLSKLNTANLQHMGQMFDGCSNLISIELSNFETENVTNMNGLFAHCQSLTNLNLSSFNTANVEGMLDMFSDCSSLTSLDLSHFKTDNVKDMAQMFYNCSSLANLDISGFNTANVDRMIEMFYGCSSLTNLDLSHFKPLKGSLRSMFSGCSSLNSLNISGLATDDVDDMCAMFYDCSSLTNLDVSGFNTDKVTSISWMFSGCSNLTTLDISSFNTSNVYDMRYLFENCSNLKTIYGGDGWDMSQVTSTYGKYMFTNCTSLVGGQGTPYDANHTDYTYARIDGLDGLPGYFSLKLSKGDANGDGKVNIKDAVITVTSILGQPTDTYFYQNAANMNDDDEIDIFDVSMIVTAVLNANEASPARGIDNIDDEDVRLTKQANRIYLDIDREGAFTAFQFDVTLPEGTALLGASLARGGTNHQLTFVKRGDNQYRVVGLSMTNEVFSASDGHLIKLQLSGSSATGQAKVSNVLFVNTPAKDITAIREHRSGEGAEDYIYDLRGQYLGKDKQKLSKGIYVINGKKMYIK